jgi:hypothetical protein
MSYFDGDISPVGWSMGWSVPFVDLLALVAASYTFAYRAKRILSAELAARLNTSNRTPYTDWDPLIQPGSDQTGRPIADDFADRGAATSYRGIGGTSYSFPYAVERFGVLQPPTFVQATAIAAYRAALSSALSDHAALMSDVGAVVTQDPSHPRERATRICWPGSIRLGDTHEPALRPRRPRCRFQTRPGAAARER